MDTGNARPNQSQRSELLKLSRLHLNRGQVKLAQLMNLPVELHASGASVWADDGQEYLDCSGYGVFFLGHRHPRVVKAVRAQLDQLALSTRVLPNATLVAAATALAGVAPGALTKVSLTTSGAEAVELALKLARLSGRLNLVAMENGFHGKTMGALSATGRDRYRKPFEPLLEGVRHVPFGDGDSLEAALLASPPSAVLVEPIQGEAGVVVPPDGFLAKARALCDRHGALLIVDEIQTGLGRTGRWWGIDRERVAPDILLAGKSLGGGILSCGAVVATEEVYRPLDREPLLHSSTFAGSPLVSSAVEATLRVIEDEGLVERARVLGATLLADLTDVAAESEVLTEVRGAGLLIGLEFAEPSDAVGFFEGLLDRRVLACWSLNSDTVVRLMPPAVLSDPQADQLLHSIREAIRSLDAFRLR